jgi:hypothetical protein
MAVALVVGLITLLGCQDTGGDAGNTAPADPADLPAHAVAPEGPAMTGTVRDAYGHAVPAAQVTVTLMRSTGERSEIGLEATFSLGLSCLVEKRGCQAPTSTGTSAADGSFAVPMPTNNGATPVGVGLSAVAALADAARVGTELVLPATDRNGAKVDIPIAAKSMSPEHHGTAMTVTMPPVVGAITTAPSELTVTQLAANGTTADATTDFSQTKVHQPFDTRLAEDSRLLLTGRQTARINGSDAMLSATQIVTGDAVPISRGAACSLTDSEGKARPRHPCGLTDGVLGASWTPDDDPACAKGPCPGTAQHDHRDMLITLPRSVTARLLVIRGCGFTCSVTVSADGKTYRDLPAPGSQTVQGFYVQMLSGKPVRYVRVRTAIGAFFDLARGVNFRLRPDAWTRYARSTSDAPPRPRRRSGRHGCRRRCGRPPSPRWCPAHRTTGPSGPRSD